MASEPLLGVIFAFAGNFAPRGYALCQGQLMSIAQNTALFSILGTTYGGDGRVTFALPDLRGRAPVGAGQGPGLSNVELGEQTGAPQTTLTIANLPAHTHVMSASQGADSTNPSNNFFGSDARGNPVSIYSTTSDGSVMNPMVVGLAGGNQPISIQNPILAINYVIATEGIFPSRN
jgi:microcystin-dependent protein